MQPTYFPWAGYFNLIKSVDVFVFLDDVQYERGTWQNRNRVLVSGKPNWLTVPVTRGRLGDTLDQVRTDEKLPWRRKQTALLQQGYARHPHVGDVLWLAELLNDNAEGEILATMNMKIIGSICDRLGIATKIVRASRMDILGKRSERLIRFCERLQCDEYLSPPGALEYLTQDQFVAKTDVRLLINEYPAEPYEQRGVAEFVSHLSIIDIVANLGWVATADYVGRQALVRHINRESQ